MQHKQPDPKAHKVLSFVKSGIRIIGCAVLSTGNLPAAAGAFTLAEVVGIVEELV